MHSRCVPVPLPVPAAFVVILLLQQYHHHYGVTVMVMHQVQPRKNNALYVKKKRDRLFSLFSHIKFKVLINTSHSFNGIIHLDRYSKTIRYGLSSYGNDKTVT